jgi:NitT/TauT family transport system substrate-binding protein
VHSDDQIRRLFLAATAGLTLTGLSACQRPEPLVRVATNAWVGYEPLLLARDLGHFDAANLRLLELTSNSGSLMALASGQTEAAALTLDELLVAREGGLDLQVLMVFDESAGADVVMARPDISDLALLRWQFTKTFWNIIFNLHNSFSQSLKNILNQETYVMFV